MNEWYGIEGVDFEWRGAWNGPRIHYKGMDCNATIVEDTMWERYLEDGGDPDRFHEDFAEYMREHADDVKELIELACA